MAQRIKLVLTGFDDLLAEIEQAGGEIKPAVDAALSESINIIDSDIRAGALARNLSTDRLITPVVNWNGNTATAEAGFKLGSYDADNPNSAYLALFKEYGTKERKTDSGANRGKIEADPFIRPAKEKNAARIKRIQKNALEKILGDLKK